ncbi:hypothetical protein HCN44_000477 [Aphidius gifuensis]|uniref:Ribosomal protein S18 n=1 Tax=Aphidius gifuensis TaxID=684658 RepID=A0A834XQC3_APHGI|nr:hypothetical protein HCN44_000477 [Aphidius gifuensis]
MALRQTLFTLGKKLLYSQSQRSISVTPVLKLKENVGNGSCLLCSTGVDVKHTDVLILSQFLKSNGGVLPRRITGLCKVQQKRVGIMITMAQKAGLMPNIAPKNSNKDPKKRRGVKKNNVYYDEDTIKHKFYGVQYQQ